ncbi:phosphatidic acid phosphatase [Chloroflexota bacterium]
MTKKRVKSLDSMIKTRKKLAKLASDLLNPFLVSFAVIILLSFESTSSLSEAIKWSLITAALSVLPVFLVVISLVKNKKVDGIFTSARRQRYTIYLMASTCGIIGDAVLFYLEAPTLLVATFTAGLAAIITFMMINLMWKISLHTAFAAASVTILSIVYGTVGALTAVLLLTVAWARIELKHHSPAQVAAGALLAAAIVVLVFRLFGLI